MAGRAAVADFLWGQARTGCNTAQQRGKSNNAAWDWTSWSWTKYLLSVVTCIARGIGLIKALWLFSCAFIYGSFGIGGQQVGNPSLLVLEWKLAVSCFSCDAFLLPNMNWTENNHWTHGNVFQGVGKEEESLALWRKREKNFSSVNSWSRTDNWVKPEATYIICGIWCLIPHTVKSTAREW